MASSTEQGPRVLFSEAIKVERLDSHAYRVDLNESFCIGTVPNGGYVASCMLAAARMHLTSRGQGDTLTAHFEYPDRTAVGPAVVTVTEVKLGRRITTLHLTLWQGEGLLAEPPWVTRGTARCAVLAYANLADLRSFDGITIPTGYEGTAAGQLPERAPDFAALAARGSDGFWEVVAPPRGSEYQKSLRNWRLFLPRRGESVSPGVLNMWMCLASGERITQVALPYVVDSFPFNLHMFLVAPEVRALSGAAPRRGEDDAPEKKTHRTEGRRGATWLPTVVLNLEVKTVLPAAGVEWLAMRVIAKQIRGGKFDLDVLVRDVDGEIVALSHQVALVLSLDRNTSERRSSSAKAAL